MTTLELRTSITADLDQMSAEMLENVSRYVKRLRHYSRPSRNIAKGHQIEASQLSPRVLKFQRGNPWYTTDEEVDSLRQEYLMSKYQ